MAAINIIYSTNTQADGCHSVQQLFNSIYCKSVRIFYHSRIVNNYLISTILLWTYINTNGIEIGFNGEMQKRNCPSSNLTAELELIGFQQHQHTDVVNKKSMPFKSIKALLTTVPENTKLNSRSFFKYYGLSPNHSRTNPRSASDIYSIVELLYRIGQF